jgi:hypothetical protein
MRCLSKLDHPVWQTRCSRISRQNRTKRKQTRCLGALIFSLPPLSLSTKKSWGDLQVASLIVFTFFVAFLIVFIIVSMSRWRGVKRRRVRWGWTSRSTIVQSKPTKSCVTIPLLHQVFNLKSSNHFFKGFNLWAFFSPGGNGRARGLQVEVRVNFLDRFGVFLSYTPIILSLHISGMLGLVHPKELVDNLLNRRRGLVSLLPSPSSSSKVWMWHPLCYCNSYNTLMVPHYVTSKLEWNPSVVWFEFQIQTLFLIFKSSHIDTCIGTLISCIQVRPTKFTFAKIKSR